MAPPQPHGRRDPEVEVVALAAPQAAVGERHVAVVGVLADVVQPAVYLERARRPDLAFHLGAEIVADGPEPADVFEEEPEVGAAAVADRQRPAPPALGRGEVAEGQPDRRRDAEQPQADRPGVDRLAVHDLDLAGLHRVVRVVQVARRVRRVGGVDDVRRGLLDDPADQEAVVQLGPRADDAAALRAEVVGQLAPREPVAALREAGHPDRARVALHGSGSEHLGAEEDLHDGRVQRRAVVLGAGAAVERRPVVGPLAAGEGVARGEDEAERVDGGEGDGLLEPALGRWRQRHAVVGARRRGQDRSLWRLAWLDDERVGRRGRRVRVLGRRSARGEEEQEEERAGHEREEGRGRNGASARPRARQRPRPGGHHGL